jgi:DNA-binding IclR family transcriptional regulator
VEIAQTADHALRILMSLSERGPQTVGELSGGLGLGRTVTRRLVATLQQRGFVSVDDGRVTVGPTVLAIAARALPNVYREAQPLIEDLARDVGETVVVSVLEGRDSLVMASATARTHPLRVEYPLGFRHPAGAGAAGRAILVDLPEAQALDLLGPGSDGTRRQRFLEERRRGHVVSHDELRIGASGIAVPLRIAQRAGSLSIVAPTSRGDALPQHLDRLHSAAQRLSTL